MSKKGIEWIDSDLRHGMHRTTATLLAIGSIPFAATAAGEAMAEHRTLNPLYGQERIGRYAASIMIHKFRTLPDKASGIETHGGFQHPDASPIAKVIRRSSIDEIPQLLNVINGDINLVGIRPIARSFFDYYKSFVPQGLFSEWEEWYALNPGLTGIGQLYTKQAPQHDEATIIQRMRHDVAGCENASLWNDIKTIIATPPIILGNSLGFRIGPGELPPDMPPVISPPVLDGAVEVATI